MIVTLMSPDHRDEEESPKSYINDTSKKNDQEDEKTPRQD